MKHLTKGELEIIDVNIFILNKEHNFEILNGFWSGLTFLNHFLRLLLNEKKV